MGYSSWRTISDMLWMTPIRIPFAKRALGRGRAFRQGGPNGTQSRRLSWSPAVSAPSPIERAVGRIFQAIRFRHGREGGSLLRAHAGDLDGDIPDLRAAQLQAAETTAAGGESGPRNGVETETTVRPRTAAAPHTRPAALPQGRQTGHRPCG